MQSFSKFCIGHFNFVKKAGGDNPESPRQFQAVELLRQRILESCANLRRQPVNAAAVGGRKPVTEACERQGMVADQETRPRLEQVCWSLQFHVRQLERRLARLQEQLYPR